MKNEYILRNTVLRKEVNIILDPIPKKDFREAGEKRAKGRQRVDVHNTTALHTAITSVCHTIAHAP